MSEPDFDGAELSMYLLATMGSKLISQATALEIARMVLRDRHGQSELDRQSPLTIVAEDNNWVVRGSHKPDFDDGRGQSVLRQGSLKMVISQIDGRITAFAFEGGVRWPPFDPTRR